jgi:hypothetical protein
MPSRTVVYAVGAATGLVVGVVFAGLNRASGRERLQRLLGRGAPEAVLPTHIVLPDVEVATATAVDGVLDGHGAPAPLSRA